MDHHYRAVERLHTFHTNNRHHATRIYEILWNSAIANGASQAEAHTIAMKETACYASLSDRC